MNHETSERGKQILSFWGITLDIFACENKSHSESSFLTRMSTNAHEIKAHSGSERNCKQIRKCCLRQALEMSAAKFS